MAKHRVRSLKNSALPATQNSGEFVKDSVKKPAKNKNGGPTWGEDLLEDVLQLGGSKEDLEFLKDVDDDDEEEEIVTEATKGIETNLKNDITSFIKGLGLDAEKLAMEIEVEDEEEEANEKWENEEEQYKEGEEEEGGGGGGEEEEVKKNIVSSTTNATGKVILIIPPTPKWHELALPSLAGTLRPAQLSDSFITKKLTHAKDLLTTENTNSENHPSLSSSDRSFLSTILGSGTVNDKVSALTLLVQESPIHAIKTLNTLMGMAKKKGRKEAVMAVTSLKDLFVGSVLPDRKLRFFRDQPVWDKKVTDQHWIVWAFEDHFKKLYFEFIQLIEVLSHDPLTHVRHSILTCIYDLLVAKPEQEQNLLKLLVNKLGDSENKVSAKVSYLLQQLLLAHPAMKLYVVREVEQLIMRSNISERAQYYGIVTINQIILLGKDVEVANKLVDIYFMLFRKLLAGAEKRRGGGGKIQHLEDGKKKRGTGRENKNKKGNEEEVVEDGVDSKMVAAVLTGVNRAFPFAKVEDAVYESNIDVLFRITHTGTFNTSIQALMLIFQVSSAKQAISDRFYRTLYESLFDPRLITSSKQAMYLNLLFKALRADSDMKRVKAFVKRIVQVAAYHQPPFVCGSFYLLSEVIAQQPGLRALVFQPEENDEGERFVDVDEDDVDDKKMKGQKVNIPAATTSQKYDGRKRDPQYSNADNTCLWELSSFITHFHPSVALYASKLLEGKKINTQPELHLHTLAHFLDRFVYRNAKKQSTTKGGSIMQPLTGMSAKNNVVTLRRGAGVELGEVNVNAQEFWRRKVENVPVDQIFFHKYFTQKLASEPTSNKKDKKSKPAGSDDFLEDEDEDEDEDEVWKAMMGSMPGGVNIDGDEDEGDVDEDDEDEEMRALLMGESDDEIDDGEDGEEVGMQEGLDIDDDEWEDLSGEENGVLEETKKRKAGKTDEKQKTKKQRLKNLPTFASFEDYASMLDDD